jgi:putrescine transport system permease protein
MSARRIFARPARYAAIAPYLWMVLFFLVPFGFVLKISLSQTAIAQPPYLPVFDLRAGLAANQGGLRSQLSLDNFKLLVSDNLYILSYLRSLVVALSRRSILLLIGYPIAYGMARLPQRWQACDDAGDRAVLDLVPDPHLCLDQHPAARRPAQQNAARAASVSTPVVWLSTDTAMYLGIVYSYLPFMILPLYATLAKMDPALLEAAADLGASRAAGVLAGDVSAVAAGRRRRRAAVLHPDRRRVRHPRSARRLGFADDRPDAVAGILHQQGLAGGLRRAVVLLVLLVAPILIYPALQRRQLEER